MNFFQVGKQGILLRRLLSSVRANPRYRRHQAKIVLGVAIAFCLLQFFIQLSSGVMVSAWMRDFAISADLAGVLSAAYFVVYTLLQTPVGVLMDRFGPRRLLSIGAAISAVFCVLFAMTHSFGLAILARVAIGTWSAFAFVGCLSLVRSWFAPTRYAMLVGLVETIGLLCAIVGDLIMASCMQYLGWRFFMMSVGMLLLAISLAARAFIKDTPTPADLEALAEKPADYDMEEQKQPFWPILKYILRDKQSWLNGLIYGLMFSLVSVFAGLWAVPFLQKHYEVSLTVATAAASMIFVGAAMGGPLLGMRIHGQERGRQVLIAGSFVAAMLVSCVIYLPRLPLYLVFPMLLTAGFACSAYIFTFSFAKERAPKGGYATMVGFTNALGVGMAPVLQPLLGWLLYIVRSHHGITHDSPTLFDYEVALSVIPIALVVAGVGAAFIKIHSVVPYDDSQCLPENG